MAFRPGKNTNLPRMKWYTDMFTKLSEIMIQEDKVKKLPRVRTFANYLQKMPSRCENLDDFYKHGFLQLATYKPTYVDRFLYHIFKGCFSNVLDGKSILYNADELKMKSYKETAEILPETLSVISIKLDKENYPIDHLETIFSKYFFDVFGESVKLKEMKSILYCWYDMLISHSVPLSEVFKTVSGINWVKRALPKLTSDFGVLIDFQKNS